MGTRRVLGRSMVGLAVVLLVLGGCDEPVEEPTDGELAGGGGDSSGAVVYTSYEHSSSQIYKWTPDGAVTNLSGASDDEAGEGIFPAGDFMPDVTPDGARIVFGSNQRPGGLLFTMDLDGGDLLAVDTGGLEPLGPRWSPAGRLVVFTAGFFGANRAIWVVDTEGTAFPSPRQVTFPAPGESDHGGVSFFDDSKEIVFCRWDGSQYDLFVGKTFDAEETPLQVTETPDRLETLPTLSPDRSLLAYAVDGHLPGQGQIEVRAVDDLDQIVHLLGFPGLAYGAIGGLTFSADGSALIVSLGIDDPGDATPFGMTFELVRVPLDGAAVVRMTDNAYAEAHPSAAPGV